MDECETLADECYFKLKRALIEGVYLPSQKLKMDELSKDFSMGFSPIREALSRLAVKQLVVLVSNKGFSVRPFNETEMIQYYQSFHVLFFALIHESMQSNNSSTHQKILIELNHLGLLEKTRYLTDYNEWSKRRRNFLNALSFGSGLTPLEMIKNDLFDHIERYETIAFRIKNQPIEANHKAHEDLAGAVLMNDSVATKERLNNYIHTMYEKSFATLKQHGYI